MSDLEYWRCEDVKLNFSEKRLASFLRALLQCNGKLTDSFCFGDWMHRRWSDSWVAAIGLKPGLKERFEQLSGLKLLPPLKVHLNAEKPPQIEVPRE